MPAEALATVPSVPRLLRRYRQQVIPELSKRFGYQNPLQAPRLRKVVVNMGVGVGAQDTKAIEQAQQELALITGQRPILTKAKTSISNFKIKKGQPVGVKVTLRRARMYEFIDRLINVAMPRIRDFRGLPPQDGFDAFGNYTLGLTEQLIFPEIDYDKVGRIQGMHVTFCTTANTREEALALLTLLGMPFREKG